MAVLRKARSCSWFSFVSFIWIIFYVPFFAESLFSGTVHCNIPTHPPTYFWWYSFISCLESSVFYIISLGCYSDSWKLCIIIIIIIITTVIITTTNIVISCYCVWMCVCFHWVEETSWVVVAVWPLMTFASFVCRRFPVSCTWMWWKRRLLYYCAIVDIFKNFLLQSQVHAPFFNDQIIECDEWFPLMHVVTPLNPWQSWIGYSWFASSSSSLSVRGGFSCLLHLFCDDTCY